MLYSHATQPGTNTINQFDPPTPPKTSLEKGGSIESYGIEKLFSLFQMCFNWKQIYKNTTTKEEGESNHKTHRWICLLWEKD